MAERYKIVIFVPLAHADQVRAAMGGAGAGRIGNYSFASFSSKGVGRFIPEAGAHPAVGAVGRLAEVEEERIEMLCDAKVLRGVIDAIKQVHPYEEVVYEVYRLEAL